MPPKRGKSFEITPPKKSRKTISLEQKLDIIQRSERGESGADIGRTLGLPGTTVRTIVKNAERIKRYVKVQTPLDTVRLVQDKKTLPKTVLLDLENILNSWYADQIYHGQSVDFKKFKKKALSVYKELTKDIIDAEPFTASRGWYERYNKRLDLNISDSGSEIINSDSEITIDDQNSFIHNLCEAAQDNSSGTRLSDVFNFDFSYIIRDGGYCSQQIFCVDETILFWKWLSILTSDGPTDHTTLLLGSNVSGDFKLKPLIVHSIENAQALNGYSKDKLPVIWKTDKTACMTQVIFSDWFTGYFCPAVEQYCAENNLPNKVLLIIDKKPGYPTSLDDLSDNVKVIYLHVNSSLQPIHKDIFQTFKAYYIQRIFAQALIATEYDTNSLFKEFWNAYDIKKAIGNISDAWHKIKLHTMNELWRRIYPNCVLELGVQDESIETTYENIFEMGKALGFKTLSIDDIRFMTDNNEKLIIKLQTQDQMTDDIEDNSIKMLTAKMLNDVMRHLGAAMTILNENDPDYERSLSVCRSIENAVACYRQLYRAKKKTALQCLNANSTNFELIISNSPETVSSSSDQLIIPAVIKTEPLSPHSSDVY